MKVPRCSILHEQGKPPSKEGMGVQGSSPPPQKKKKKGDSGRAHIRPKQKEFLNSQP